MSIPLDNSSLTQARMTIDPLLAEGKMNVSQLSYEWPALFLDKVEWVQHANKTGVFFHEENIFSLWTLKVENHTH